VCVTAYWADEAKAAQRIEAAALQLLRLKQELLLRLHRAQAEQSVVGYV